MSLLAFALVVVSDDSEPSETSPHCLANGKFATWLVHTLAPLAVEKKSPTHSSNLVPLALNLSRPWELKRVQRVQLDNQKERLGSLCSLLPHRWKFFVFAFLFSLLFHHFFYIFILSFLYWKKYMFSFTDGWCSISMLGFCGCSSARSRRFQLLIFSN